MVVTAFGAVGSKVAPRAVSDVACRAIRPIPWIRLAANWRIIPACASSPVFVAIPNGESAAQSMAERSPPLRFSMAASRTLSFSICGTSLLIPPARPDSIDAIPADLRAIAWNFSGLSTPSFTSCSATGANRGQRRINAAAFPPSPELSVSATSVMARCTLVLVVASRCTSSGPWMA
jgi:hypothetical protein